RAYDDQVMDQMLAAIRRMADGLGRAAGLPDDRLPVVIVTPESAQATSNDATLARRLGETFTSWFGSEGAQPTSPVTAAEDFTYFARTNERVPICMWWVGATAPEKFAESKRTGQPVPSNHNPGFAPVPEPTLKACATSMTAAVLELLGKK